MRTHGWRGDPPADDIEARDRIIDALVRCVERFGPRKTSLTDVAEDLGVTRATIYRYYRNIEDLRMAAMVVAATDFQARIIERVTPLADPAEIMVEVMAYAVESLTAEQQAGFLGTLGLSGTLGHDVLSPSVRAGTKNFLLALPVDWPRLGYDDEGMDGLVEFILRLISSYIAVPERDRPDSRRFLRRWVVPGLVAAAPDPAPTR
ncbi:TetR/AcrR family transcriptional regulator [Actinocorallia longicatena]|uniref:TetR/AcrR family transcriptional regulator n=1 Tax=Actinocorallia longicatena TaxID=111803 RepID=A0ABP6Q4G8_9ACTN